eukprot:399567-Rhodomonas_salina.1
MTWSSREKRVHKFKAGLGKSGANRWTVLASASKVLMAAASNGVRGMVLTLSGSELENEEEVEQEDKEELQTTHLGERRCSNCTTLWCREISAIQTGR